MGFNRLSRPVAPPPPAAIPRSVRKPLTLQEWLGDMVRFNGRDADRARELLERLDEAEDDEALLIEYGEKVGDLDDAQKQVERLAALDEWAEGNMTFKEFGALDEDGLNCFVEAYEAKERITDALHDLLVEAGLLNASDYATDPLPLLRMFLPVDE